MQTARLFMQGRSQAVRLPDEFRFAGEEVLIRRDPISGEVILSPKPATWDDFFRLRDRLRQHAPQDFDGFLAGRDGGEHGERDWP